MVRSFFIATLFTVAHAVVGAQEQPDVPALWKELATNRSVGELARAEAAAGKLVDALRPSAKDFSLGVQLNSALHNRASLRYNRGDFAGAEADLLASVEQAKAIGLPPGLPAQAMPPMQAMVDERVRLSLRGVMNFHLAAGDLERATRAFEEAEAIPPSWKKQGDTGVSAAHQILAAEVTSMAGTFHRATGDYTRAAEAIVARVEEIDGAWATILRESGGVEDSASDRTKMNWLRARSNLLMDLAEIASLRERHEEAVGFCDESRKAAQEMLPLYRRWAEEAMQPGGPVPPETIRKSLENVEAGAHYLMHERAALILRAAGREQAALGLMLEGLAEREGKDGPQRFLTLDYNVVRPGESLKLVGDLEAIPGNTAAAAVRYEEAIALTKQHFPEGHPAVIEIEESRALLAHLAGDEAESGRLAREVLAMRMENLEEVLAFADEPTRLAYRSSVDPWSLFASLDLPEELATVVLRTKGVVLESLLEDRGIAARSTDPDLAETIEALDVVRRRLMEHLLAGGNDADDTVAGLRSRIADLESRLITGDGAEGPQRSRKAIRTGLAEVVEALPEGGALIEFIRYRHITAPGRFENRYGAIVVRSDGPPVWVPLDPAEAVEEAMALYARAVRAEPADGEMEAFLTALGQGIWDPLLPHLPEEGKPLILSPDGDLNFLSFATLLGPGGRLVGEVWPITYVSSGRDLLRSVRPTRREAMEIVANPDFQTPSTTAVAAMRDPGGGAAVAMRGVLGRIGLSPLPGTKEEATALHELVADRWGWRLSSHMEASADEESVNAVASPGILHLATHGFYLPRTGRTDALERARGYWLEAGEAARAPVLESFSDVVLDQPMHRSGIALAGAAATLREWSAGRILETSNDGILTAAEMARLDLAGTWLVVLSACETGLGEARSGEGVLGMRRGLLEAGTQHLFLTLWPVADAETARYMLDFYRALDGGGVSPVEAAPAVQAAALKRIREEQGLTAAVKLAGPFVLSFRN